VIGDVLPIAQAAHNHRGPVIAQVKRILDYPAPPFQVKVPGRLISHIVLADQRDHWQTFGEPFNASYCQSQLDHTQGVPSAEGDGLLEPSQLGLDVRRIIAERACDELPAGAIANLGIGLPEGIAVVAAQRKLLSSVTFTIESGPIGGIPAGGLSFGSSSFPEAIIDQPSQFDFYDGGGLDFAALGAAQIDQYGNVNVSRFGSRFAGVGGFINISQNARRLVFCGSFTADGLQVRFENGELRIINEGRVAKFVKRVEQVSFSGPMAQESARDVVFVTERAVFRLQREGIELIEVAKGVDIDSDILERMEFVPIIRTVREMAIGRERRD
jgi:propionate CoA-transferase